MTDPISKRSTTRIGSNSSPTSHWIAAGLVVLTLALLTIANSLSKSLSPRIAPAEVLFLQGIVSLIMLAPYFARGPRLRPTHLGLHLIRDISGSLAFLFTYLAASTIPIGDAMLLNAANALWVPLILLIGFRQRIPWRLLVCLIVGFIGVWMILRPGSELFEPMSLFGLLGGVCMAIAMISLRRLTLVEPMRRIIFFFCLVATLLGGLLTAPVWITPTVSELLQIGYIGVAMGLGQLLLTKAYQLAAAAALAPFFYSAVLYGWAIDWLVWGHLPHWWGILGAVLIVGSALVSTKVHASKSLG